ncbi:permease [Kibdelosporangium persicum]|uniref:Permease n=1 Tax=Kibdelosporangium persicum TaxID=2698649 RepID=A0ABX2F6M5_9PSEU|nr:permease [Kibdelosporangium persicum]NRN66809.1 Permease [Kibdelosporangium persicum]
MTTVAADQEDTHHHPKPRRRLPIGSLEILCVLLVVAVVFQDSLASLLGSELIRTAATRFVAVCVQAIPFLVLGVLISGAIAAFIPASALRKVLPRRQALAVPVAGVAGVALPGCECASVPVSRRLMQQGVAPSVALAFLLAAPAVNPIVLVATAVAFPGNPEMVAGRFFGSLATAIVMGWLWARFGKLEWMAERALRRIPDRDGRSRWLTFVETARHDLVDSGGFLVIGGLTAAILGVVVPASWLDSLSEQIVLSVIVMALLAVILAICSEADAFVAASLSMLPLLPRLVFLVVGPAVDVKLVALQAGTFGKSFAFRFAPATFLVAIACALAAGYLVGV